jgi:hypothetical protein
MPKPRKPKEAASGPRADMTKEEEAGYVKLCHENRLFAIGKPLYFRHHPQELWRFNPMQEKLIEAWKNLQYKVFVYSGANRIGKSEAWGIIAPSVMHGMWPWSGEPIVFPHTEPRKIRVVGQAWESHVKAVVEPKLKQWWPSSWKVETKKNNQGVEYFWKHLRTGSTLEIMSNVQDSSVFEGWMGDLVIYDEPPKRDVRVACARGLIDRNGRELFCCTMLKEAWLHREVIKALLPDGSVDPSVFCVNGDIQQNVGYGLTQEGVEQFRKTLRYDEIQARIMGKPSYMSSLVWPEFSRDANVKIRFPVPLDWMVDIQIDFHPAKPWNILFLATDKRGFKYVVEGWKERGNPKYIAESVIRKIKEREYRVSSLEIDPLSKGNENVIDGTVFGVMGDIFASHGFCLEAASKDKDSGMVMVRDLWKTENDMAALFVFSDLGEVITQIEDYMTDPETLKPSKENDDFCECLYRAVLKNTQWYPVYQADVNAQRSMML